MLCGRASTRTGSQELLGLIVVKAHPLSRKAAADVDGLHAARTLAPKSFGEVGVQSSAQPFPGRAGADARCPGRA